ncbi:MAG: hypothetical protein L3J05_07935, partial [Robiginitomaculum sp.]|nr:hypothetical protein [Robiginitomaculum sp.]
MDKSVTSIGGSDILPGEPDEFTIQAFEGLLERARSGDIVGAVCILNHSDRSASYEYCGWFHGFTFMG